jgi:hydrogenase nickel incorporation protein HypA/HybF
MHELGLAQEIVEIACERSRDGARITRVVVAVGRLSVVLPDALRFCFDEVTRGTPAEGAELAILETPGLARCRACGASVELERPFGRCRCESTDLEWVSGDELEVREVEVGDVHDLRMLGG